MKSQKNKIDYGTNTEDIINMRIFFIKEILELLFKQSKGNPIATDEVVSIYMANAHKSKTEAKEIVDAVIFKLKKDMIYEPMLGMLQRL